MEYIGFLYIPIAGHARLEVRLATTGVLVNPGRYLEWRQISTERSTTGMDSTLHSHLPPPRRPQFGCCRSCPTMGIIGITYGCTDCCRHFRFLFSPLVGGSVLYHTRPILQIRNEYGMKNLNDLPDTKTKEDEAGEGFLPMKKKRGENNINNSKLRR